jgi:hypothetical protein
MGRRARLGWIVATVALHAGVFAWLAGSGAVRVPGLPGSTMDLVWITPPRPSPTPPPPPKAAPDPVKRAVAVRARRARSAEERLDAARPDAATPMATTARPDPAGPAAGEPVFDRSAALAAARGMANERDPGRADLPVGQFDSRRQLRKTEAEKLGQAIASGKRGDCIAANGGGSLLSPLMWLIDKKDHGCKL